MHVGGEASRRPFAAGKSSRYRGTALRRLCEDPSETARSILTLCGELLRALWSLTVSVLRLLSCES